MHGEGQPPYSPLKRYMRAGLWNYRHFPDLWYVCISKQLEQRENSSNSDQNNRDNDPFPHLLACRTRETWPICRKRPSSSGRGWFTLKQKWSFPRSPARENCKSPAAASTSGFSTFITVTREWPRGTRGASWNPNLCLMTVGLTGHVQRVHWLSGVVRSGAICTSLTAQLFCSTHVFW